MMGNLSSTEQNLVSLGAALASNSARCVEHYISETRKAGYTDRQIQEAIDLADRARRVPEQNVLDAAIGLLSQPTGSEASSPGAGGTEAGRRREATAGEKKPDSAGSPSQTAGAARNRCCC